MFADEAVSSDLQSEADGEPLGGAPGGERASAAAAAYRDVVALDDEGAAAGALKEEDEVSFVGADAGEGVFDGEPEGAFVVALVGVLEEELNALQGEDLVEVVDGDLACELFACGSTGQLDLLGEPGVEGEVEVRSDAAGAAHGGGCEVGDLFAIDEPLDGFACLDDPCKVVEERALVASFGDGAGAGGEGGEEEEPREGAEVFGQQRYEFHGGGCARFQRMGARCCGAGRRS